MEFSVRISSVNVTKSATFTAEILNGKHFLCSELFLLAEKATNGEFQVP